MILHVVGVNAMPGQCPAWAQRKMLERMSLDPEICGIFYYHLASGVKDGNNNIRMVSCHTVLQDHFVILAIKVRWFRPPQIVHLFDE